MDSLLVSMHRLNHLLGLAGSPGWARLFVLWGKPGAVCSGGAESQEKGAEVDLLCVLLALMALWTLWPSFQPAVEALEPNVS